VSLASESDTDLLHLLGSDVITGNDEDTGARVEQVLELIEISGLLSKLLGISWCHLREKVTEKLQSKFNPEDGIKRTKKNNVR
jgi:hypothetical protein